MIEYRYESPKKPVVVLIGYKKRNGKDTFAEYLHKYLKNSEIYHFADKMKQIIADMFEISLDELEDFKNNEANVFISDNGVIKHINFRKILQNFGSNSMKDIFGDDIWAKLVHQNMKSNCCYNIIPDFRFLSEYNYFKDRYKVVTIKVDRGLEGDNHKSEKELGNFEFDFVVDNTKDLKYLEYQAKKIADIISMNREFDELPENSIEKNYTR